MHAQFRTAAPLGGRRTLRTLILAALLALGGMAMLATSAQAAEEQGRNKFASIAIDPSTNTAGWSFNYNTRALAQRRALSECRVRSSRNGCRIVTWVRNGCVAVAARRRGSTLVRWAGNFAPTRAGAQRRARSRCQSDGRACFIRAWACSG